MRTFIIKCLARIKLLPILFFTTSLFAQGVDKENNTIVISLSTEPPTLDSSLSEDSVSSFVLGTIQEGLVRVDARGDIQPAIAESWTITETGAIFNLRKNARWSDGKIISAQDFVYSWRRLVDPKTGASGSTFFAFVLKNGEAIIRGEKSKNELGVIALNDHRLEVITSKPIPYLLKALSIANFFPLREDFVTSMGDHYAADSDKMLFSGPYILNSWIHGASLSFKKNIHYWNQSAVMLSNIDASYITQDKRALLNLYRAKELATLDLNGSLLDDVIENGYRIRKKTNNCSSIITLNHRQNRATSNKNLRKALQFVFDPAIYANRIIAVPGTTASYSVFPSYLKAQGKPFTEQFPVALKIPYFDKAKVHLALAKAELGEIPNLVLLSREGNEKKDEYLQALFKESLGLDIKIDRQNFKQAIVRLIAGEFDLAFSGFCSGTMDDPFMSATNYTSTHPYNDGKFKSDEYDRLYNFTSTTTDQNARMQAFSNMQDILLEEAVVLPTHESSDIYVQEDAVRRLYYGAKWDFSWARIR